MQRNRIKFLLPTPRTNPVKDVNCVPVLKALSTNKGFFQTMIWLLKYEEIVVHLSYFKKRQGL